MSEPTAPPLPLQQAIARGLPTTRIMAEHGASYQDVYDARRWLDHLNEERHACPHCGDSYVNLKQHVYAAHHHPRPLREIPCGTQAGYSAHRRRRERMCQPCRDAHAAYKKQLRDSSVGAV